MSYQSPRSLFDHYLGELACNSTAPKVPSPPEQWMAPIKRLPNPLPENTVVDTLSDNIMVTIDLNLTICSSCRIAIVDVLTNTFPSERWQIFRSEYDAVIHLIEHQHGDVDSLIQSKKKGCGLCALILEQLVSDKEAARSAESKYSVFVKPREATSYQLYVCLGDALRFTRPMREWDKAQAKSLRLFGRSTSYRDDMSSETRHNATVLHLNQYGRFLPKLFDNDPGSDQSFRLAHKWLQESLPNHTSCGLEQRPLPKRLVDLNCLEASNTVHLYLTSPNEMGVYATISYTWGASGYKRLKTKNHDAEHPELTEASHHAGVDVGRFPQTLQDAIHIAKRLGFRYLWIDSVCIVQDDDDDWAEQSTAMTQIYEGARLNISATSSKNSESGILRPLPQHGIQLGRVTVPRIDQKSESGDYEEDHWHIYVGSPLDVLDLEDKYLASRGWVFQERLVSAATLHYTDEGMLWESASGIKLARDQGFHRNDWKKQWKTMTDTASVSALGNQRHGGENREAILRSWNDWVAAYSERELYDFKDRLHAIAGVAKTLADRFGLKYAAGLWQEDVVGGLMWKRFNGTKTLKRFTGDRTPSWSWASVEGRLEYMDVRLKDSVKGPGLEIIGQIEVEEERPGFFGRVSSGCIHVKGMLQKIVVDKGVHPGVRQRKWEEVGVTSGFVNPVNVLVMLDEPFISDSVVLHCWCLWLGSYDDASREGDLFLLLEQVDKDGDHFRRLGFAETDAWTNSLSVTGDSGKLKSAEMRRFVLE